MSKPCVPLPSLHRLEIGRGTENPTNHGVVRSNTSQSKESEFKQENVKPPFTLQTTKFYHVLSEALKDSTDAKDEVVTNPPLSAESNQPDAQRQLTDAKGGLEVLQANDLEDAEKSDNAEDAKDNGELGDVVPARSGPDATDPPTPSAKKLEIVKTRVKKILTSNKHANDVPAPPDATEAERLFTNLKVATKACLTATDDDVENIEAKLGTLLVAAFIALRFQAPPEYDDTKQWVTTLVHHHIYASASRAFALAEIGTKFTNPRTEAAAQTNLWKCLDECKIGCWGPTRDNPQLLFHKWAKTTSGGWWALVTSNVYMDTMAFLKEELGDDNFNAWYGERSDAVYSMLPQGEQHTVNRVLLETLRNVLIELHRDYTPILPRKQLYDTPLDAFLRAELEKTPEGLQPVVSKAVLNATTTLFDAAPQVRGRSGRLVADIAAPWRTLRSEQRSSDFVHLRAAAGVTFTLAAVGCLFVSNDASMTVDTLLEADVEFEATSIKAFDEMRQHYDELQRYMADHVEFAQLTAASGTLFKRDNHEAMRLCQEVSSKFDVVRAIPASALWDANPASSPDNDTLRALMASNTFEMLEGVNEACSPFVPKDRSLLPRVQGYVERRLVMQKEVLQRLHALVSDQSKADVEAFESGLGGASDGTLTAGRLISAIKRASTFVAAGGGESTQIDETFVSIMADKTVRTAVIKAIREAADTLNTGDPLLPPPPCVRPAGPMLPGILYTDTCQTSQAVPTLDQLPKCDGVVDALKVFEASAETFRVFVAKKGEGSNKYVTDVLQAIVDAGVDPTKAKTFALLEQDVATREFVLNALELSTAYKHAAQELSERGIRWDSVDPSIRMALNEDDLPEDDARVIALRKAELKANQKARLSTNPLGGGGQDKKAAAQIEWKKAKAALKEAEEEAGAAYQQILALKAILDKTTEIHDSEHRDWLHSALARLASTVPTLRERVKLVIAVQSDPAKLRPVTRTVMGFQKPMTPGRGLGEAEVHYNPWYKHDENSNDDDGKWVFKNLAESVIGMVTQRLEESNSGVLLVLPESFQGTDMDAIRMHIDNHFTAEAFGGYGGKRNPQVVITYSNFLETDHSQIFRPDVGHEPNFDPEAPDRLLIQNAEVSGNVFSQIEREAADAKMLVLRVLPHTIKRVFEGRNKVVVTIPAFPTFVLERVGSAAPTSTGTFYTDVLDNFIKSGIPQLQETQPTPLSRASQARNAAITVMAQWGARAAAQWKSNVGDAIAKWPETVRAAWTKSASPPPPEPAGTTSASPPPPEPF